jgi:GR25 family glycosyltransferase involved in LPS biosynthesis
MIKIYVINKKKDTERLKYIKDCFKNYDLNIIEAINHDQGWKGCFLSHKKCIKIGKKLKLSYIIVIEDDCKPTINFDKNLKSILNYLDNNKNKWDIFLGGVTNVWNCNNIVKINDNLNLLNICKGKTTHFIIYNKSSYDFFLNKNIDIPIDRCWHYELKALTSVPFIAIQKNGISSIEKKYVNYNHKFKSIENNFKNIINNYL